MTFGVKHASQLLRLALVLVGIAFACPPLPAEAASPVLTVLAKRKRTSVPLTKPPENRPKKAPPDPPKEGVGRGRSN